MNDMALLENLGLIKYEGGTAHPTNALILLFSREASSVFPQARLVIWEMGDPTTIIDQRVITGSLFNQLYQGLAIVQSKLRQNYQIDGLTRTSKPEFPETVLRELVVNALVHRDYFERGAEIQIKIFPDTIEISNPGKPLYDTKPQQLLGRSLRRNPLLAEVLHRAGLVERAGTGLIRVNQLLAEHRRLPVTLTTEGEFFIATLSRQIPDDKSRGLSPRQNSILKTLSKGRKISTSEYANLYKISTRQARKDLAELISRKLVLQEKVGRNTFYVASHPQRKS
jgi:ATP-dependent DNA helicase RecG